MFNNTWHSNKTLSLSNLPFHLVLSTLTMALSITPSQHSGVALDAFPCPIQYSQSIYGFCQSNYLQNIPDSHHFELLLLLPLLTMELWFSLSLHKPALNSSFSIARVGLLDHVILKWLPVKLRTESKVLTLGYRVLWTLISAAVFQASLGSASSQTYQAHAWSEGLHTCCFCVQPLISLRSVLKCPLLRTALTKIALSL